ncbi:uncharacterized protein LOC119656979 [Hermetia illucens]|uniref:uncharacterized protein LOC119656979 n=1 Tax=Hermetia illucens TaxID=343691 RepID=UPI0018CC2F83|nr:uncharacterized protein LOC119656979 [Hermetia illucens]
MHHNEALDVDTRKLEIIAHFNLTKGEVDSIDEKCSINSCNRKTKRWPTAVFLRLVDIASVNSFIFHQSFRHNAELIRYNYIKKLGMQLIKPELERRFKNPHINREVRMCIGRALNIRQEFDWGETEILEKLDKDKIVFYFLQKK